MLDNTGSPVWSWETKDPYGYSAPDSLLSGTHFEFNLRFPGQTFDSETGLYHNGFRDYDPNRGRYIQPDPIGLQGGLNLYAHTGSDPVNGYDPLGLKIVYKDQESRNAVAYLKQHSPTAAREIQIAEDSWFDLTIGASTSKRPEYFKGKREITWDPTMYLFCRQNGEMVANPMVQLAHEIRHFNQSPLAPPWGVFGDAGLSKRDKDLFGNNFEREAIINVEGSVAKELGLNSVRTSHKIGKGTPYTTQFNWR